MFNQHFTFHPIDITRSVWYTIIVPRENDKTRGETMMNETITTTANTLTNEEFEMLVAHWQDEMMLAQWEEEVAAMAAEEGME